MFDTLAIGLGDNLHAICKLKIIVNIFASNLIYTMFKKLMFHRYYNYTQLYSISFNIMLPTQLFSRNTCLLAISKTDELDFFSDVRGRMEVVEHVQRYLHCLQFFCS